MSSVGQCCHGAASWDHRPAPVAHRDDLFVTQAEAFLDGIDGKPTPLCTLDEAIQTLAFNIAALESARTGKMVKVNRPRVESEPN